MFGTKNLMIFLFILFHSSIHIHKSFESVLVHWFSNSLPFQALQFSVHSRASMKFHFNAEQQALNFSLEDLRPKLPWMLNKASDTAKEA